MAFLDFSGGIGLDLDALPRTRISLDKDIVPAHRGSLEYRGHWIGFYQGCNEDRPILEFTPWVCRHSPKRI